MRRISAALHRHTIDTDTLASLRAFLKTILRDDAARIVYVSMLSMLGAISQIGFAYLLFRLVTGREIQIGSFVFEQNVLAVGLAVLGALAAILPFLTQRAIIQATTKYLAANVRWMRGKLADLESRYRILSSGLTQSEITRLMSSEARYASLAYASVLQIIFPGLLFLACYGALWIINPMWTFIVSVLIVPFLALSAFVVLTGIARNEELRAASIAHSRAAAAFVAGVNRHFSANRWGNTLAQSADDSYDETYVSAYGHRLSLGILLTLVMDTLTFVIVAIVALLIVFGRIDLTEVAAVLIYGLILRFGIGKLSGCVNQSVSVVSQLPYYGSFIRLKSNLRDTSITPTTAKRLVPPPASVIYVHPDGASWSVAQSYMRHVLQGGTSVIDVQTAALLASNYPPLFENYQNTLQLSPQMLKSRILEAFPQSARRAEDFEKLMALKDAPLTQARLQSLPPPVRFLIAVRYAKRNGFAKRLILVDAGDYIRLTPEERVWLDGELRDAHTVYVCANPALAPRVGADLPVLVWDSESIQRFEDAASMLQLVRELGKENSETIGDDDEHE